MQLRPVDTLYEEHVWLRSIYDIETAMSRSKAAQRFELQSDSAVAIARRLVRAEDFSAL